VFPNGRKLGNLWLPLNVQKPKVLQLQGGGASPPKSLTRGSAPAPHWRLCPQIPVIQDVPGRGGEKARKPGEKGQGRKR